MRREQNAVREIERGDNSLSDQSLVSDGGRSHHAELRKRELWAEAGESVTKSLQGLRPGAESNLIQVAHALKALGIGYEITAVELVDTRKTAITIGESSKPFDTRFEGQHERLSALLSEIEVPLSLRIRNARGIGFSDLTPEAIQNLHINNTKLRYPAFYSAVQSAYEESIRLTGERVTVAEQLRIDRNLAASERLSEFVDEFNIRRGDLSSVSLRIVTNGDDPAVLSAGPLKDRPADHIVLVRRAVLGEFGAFLKGQFLST